MCHMIMILEDEVLCNLGYLCDIILNLLVSLA